MFLASSPCFSPTACKKNLKTKANNADNKKEMEQYEQDLLRNVMPQELTELILAANYLNFKEALDFFCRAMANAIQNKSVEYFHKFFGLESDFEPGEEEKLCKEFAWSFEGVDED
uniref:SKP1 component dimerisation domain-containing protein n=1 Tax=Quercus lobata TaxID=97700 RepID=A0A7N2LKZ5_QUELO